MAVAGEVRLRVTVLAFHTACEACAGEARIEARDCEGLAWFASVHIAPTIVQAELLVNGEHRVVPVTITR